jgi:hypothetical protein
MATRELRRTTEGVRSPATFLKTCIKHRAGFRKLVSLTEQLIEGRQNAEDVLIETGDVKLPDDDDDDSIPF